MSLVRSMYVLAIPLVVWLLAGCTTSTPIRLHDRDQFAPGGRASYEIWPGVDQRRRGALLDLVTGSSDEKAVEGAEPVTARGSGVRPTVSVDGAITRVEGRDHQQVEAGQTVDLGVPVAGPVRIQTNAENLSGSVAVRGGVRLFDVLSLEGIVGVDVDHTQFRARGGGEGISTDRVRAGFLSGGRASIRPIPLFDLYAQFTVSIGDGFHEQEDQVGTELHLTRNVYLFAGYRWWKYRKDQLDGGSNVKIDIQGPTAGLGLSF